MIQSRVQGQVFADDEPGKAPVIVGLHGWARTKDDLSEVTKLAADGRRRILLDLPGFGLSPAPPAPCGTGWYADIVAACLEESDVTNAVILGHSFGGRVALRLAAARPDLVQGLVLTGVPLFRTSPGRSPFGYRVVRRLGGIMHSESLVDWGRRRWGSTDYLQAVGIMRDVLVRTVNEDYVDNLDTIRAEALRVGFVWGVEDSAAPIAGAERAAAVLGDEGRLWKVSGGHYDPLKERHSIRQAIDWIAS